MGTPLDGRRRDRAQRPGTRTIARHGENPRPAVRRGTASTGRTRGPGARPPGCGCRGAHLGLADALLTTARARPAKRRRSPLRRRLACARRGRVPRAQGTAQPDAWANAATTWDRLERPPSPPTAGGVKPKRSSDRRVPAEASKPLKQRTPSQHALARDPCYARSSRSPSGHDSTSPRQRRPPAAQNQASQRPSDSPRARRTSSPSSPAATPTAKSPPNSSSASRPRASTYRTSCRNSTRRTGARRLPSFTAWHRNPAAHKRLDAPSPPALNRE